MNIVIFGKGACGQALGSLFQKNSIPFSYCKKGEYLEKTASIVFLATPTQSLREILNNNRRFFSSEIIFVNWAKGIEKETLLLPFQIVREVVKPKYYYTLIGSSFASEINEKHPTFVSLGFAQEDEDKTKMVKNFMQTDYFRVEPTPFFEIVELSGALKNVYAILCGYAHGLGFHANTQAMFITLALKELTLVSQALKFSYDTIAIPGILGDLVLTCSSSKSRNFTFGKNLATTSPQKAFSQSNKTVEGYHTSYSLQALAKKHKLHLPVARLAHTIIEKGEDARDDFDKFVLEI